MLVHVVPVLRTVMVLLVMDARLIFLPIPRTVGVATMSALSLMVFQFVIRGIVILEVAVPLMRIVMGLQAMDAKPIYRMILEIVGFVEGVVLV